MANFEPKKLPPLRPPERKAQPPANNSGKPATPPPAAPNLPPKIGGGSKPSLPGNTGFPPANQQPQAPSRFPPAFPQQSQPTQPSPQPQPQQPQQQGWDGENYQQTPHPQQPHPQQPQQQYGLPYQEQYNNQQQYGGGNNQPYNEPQTGWGRQQAQQQYHEPEVDEDDDYDEDDEPVKNTKKGKKQDSSKKSKKNSKKSKEAKPNPYAGARKKLILTRILVFGTIGLLVASGVYSFVPKASYLTQADQDIIISKVRENLGETYFPSEAGEGWARGFLDLYLNYNPETSEERTNQLLTYTTEEVLKEIDITFLTPEEKDQLSNKEESTFEDLEEATGISETKQQVITAGPYLIKKELLPGDNTGIFSYKVQINGNNWAYIEVPVYYNMEQRGLSISGTPTFRSIIPISKPPAANREVMFENDRDVESLIANDIKAYMEAWVSSDQTGIDRYLVKEKGANAVTPQASTGLGGSVDFLSLDKMTVQTKVLPSEEDLTPEAKADFNERYVVVSIRVVEPTSGIVYRQNYQLVIQYVNENWFIQDIRSMVVFADNSGG